MDCVDKLLQLGEEAALYATTNAFNKLKFRQPRVGRKSANESPSRSKTVIEPETT
jgi:hypothetical protein